MLKASAAVTHEDRAHIAAAVAAAEAKTSAEIVPVITTASGRYDRAEDIVGLWCGALVLSAIWIVLPWERSEAGSWGLSWDRFQLGLLLAGLVAGFLSGVFLATRLAWLRLLFTSRSEMRDEVFRCARETFFDQRVHHTAGDSGLLIYLSLYERNAAVIADAKIIEVLGQSTVDALCGDLTMLLRRGNPADALCAVIADAGERLGRVLPRAADDRNELQDALILID